MRIANRDQHEPRLHSAVSLYAGRANKTKPLPAPSVPGNAEAERFYNAVRKTFTFSKEEMQRREAEWQWTQGRNKPSKKR